jgi:hypothetical protein
MALRTGSVSGDPSTTTVWGGAAVPIAGDTAELNTAITAVQTGAMTFGLDGAAGAVALTVKGTGVWILQNTLNLRGRLVLQRGCTMIVDRPNGGKLVIDSPSGGTSGYTIISDATGSGTAQLIVLGATGTHLTAIETGSRGGMNFFLDTAAQPMDLNFGPCTINKVGSATQDAFNYVGGPAGSIVMRGVRFTNHGRIQYNWGGEVDFTHDCRGCDYRSPLQSSWLFIQNSAAATRGVRVMDGTWHSNTTTSMGMDLWCVGWTFSGFAYNTALTCDIQDERNSFVGLIHVTDSNFTSTSLSVAADSAARIEDSIFVGFKDNSHYIGDNGAGSRGRGRNRLHRVIVDGGNFTPLTDNGDFAPGVTVEMHFDRVLLINHAGTLWSQLNTTGQHYARRCTLYGADVNINAAESASHALAIRQLTSSVFVNNPTALKSGGVAITTMTGFWCDHNAFFGQTDSPVSKRHPQYASQPGYVEAAYTWNNKGTYGNADGWGRNDVYLDPQFYDAARHCVAYYNMAKGVTSGTVANFVDACAKVNGTAPDGTDATAETAFVTATVFAWIWDGFRPTNEACRGAGSNLDAAYFQVPRVDLGAVDMLPPPVAPADVAWQQRM